MDARRVRLLMLFLFSSYIAFSLINGGQAQKPDAVYKPVIPKTWDKEALADLEVPFSIGTDANLTMTTRRGTGYYKVPSLKGVWYRGPFEHNGSVATLEIGSTCAACAMTTRRRDG
jgi:hypothetical protein